MQLERSTLKLSQTSAPVINQNDGKYVLRFSNCEITLTETQYQYWELFKAGQSINQIVQVFLSQGRLVSFIEIYNLLETLYAKGLVQAPGLELYFGKQQISLQTQQKNFSCNAQSNSNLKNTKMASSFQQDEIFQKIEKSLAFLRYGGADLRKEFTKRARVHNVEANTILCKSADRSRELFVIMNGSVGVYRLNSKGQQELIGTLVAGGIFGERSFFLNAPRTADVVALEKTQVAVFPHSHEFDMQINMEQSAELLSRLRAMQGLLSSKLFSSLPTETLETLAFVGKLYEVQPGQIIIQEQQIGKSFYIVIEGGFVATQKGKYLRNMGEGEVIGEIALLVSGGLRTATVQAQRRSIILEISMNEFYPILADHIILAKEIEKIAWQRFQG